MLFTQAALILVSATLAFGQRPFFAGSKPIGYPELVNRTTTTADGLGNRFGEEGTTQKLPIEALGDRDLVERLSKLPIDKQPFWLLNWKALEEQRKNPQTYPQRPSQFSETLNVGANSNSGGGNSNSIAASAAVGNKNGDVSNTNTDAVKQASTLNSELGNRNGGVSDESNEYSNSSGSKDTIVSDTQNFNYNSGKSGSEVKQDSKHQKNKRFY